VTQDALREIRSCEVCGNERLQSTLDLGPHPLCDDLVPVGDTRTCREYPIEVLLCSRCVTAHQRYQVPKSALFPSTYHYRARFTADVLSGMSQLVRASEEMFGPLSGRSVLDVGCNDGSLLDMFRERGAVTTGIEPTDAYLDAQKKGHRVFHEFLSPELSQNIVALRGKPDFITFTNVFAHIENLREVLESLRCLLAPQTTLVIENHYLGAVLAGNQFDTFYHEHPRTYSYTSFEHVARSLSIPIMTTEFPSRYGGNIRVFLGRRAIPVTQEVRDLDSLRGREARFVDDFATLRRNVERWRQSKGRSLREQVRATGKLRAKAFPGRAAILVKLLGLSEDTISAVFEKPGSLKIGHYVPGTRIPILSDEALFAMPDQDQPLLNLAWHIPTEIRTYLASHGYTGPIIDVLSADDFAAKS